MIIHGSIDLRGSISTFIFVFQGQIHEVNLLDDLIIEPGAICFFDGGHFAFARLYKIPQAGTFPLVRAKCNFCFRRLYSQSADKARDVQADQLIELQGFYSNKDYPDRPRQIFYCDAEKKRR